MTRLANLVRKTSTVAVLCWIFVLSLAWARIPQCYAQNQPPPKVLVEPQEQRPAQIEIAGLHRRAEPSPKEVASSGVATGGESSSGSRRALDPEMPPAVAREMEAVKEQVEQLEAERPTRVAAEAPAKTVEPEQLQTQSALASGPSGVSGREPARRGLPPALDSLFPSSDYLGPTPLIGVPDTDPVYPLTKVLWSAFPKLQAARIKVYGWVNPGISVSTSNKSNIPESYAIVPNRVELDQGVVRIERVPDTVQTDHVDWGFRLSPIYGIDYRWTTAQGWFSGQLLKHNYMYGFDPVEAYALLYVPSVAQGMVIKIGRYISPPDIEAQLATDNYLFTHSLMFTFDCYTQTGVSAAIKLNDHWSILAGIHAGDDIAPWNGASHPTAMAMVRWVSPSNNDSLWGGIDSLNGGKFKGGHDNLQQFNLTWTHRFNEAGTFLTTTETYYIFQTHALVGGTINNGPPHAWFQGVGPGDPIPGNAPVFGVVNYTELKLSKKDFLSLRPIDYIVDFKGERSGFATTMSSWTVGVTHRFNELVSVRPELRYEYAFNARPWDNGVRKGQLMFAIDALLRF